MKKRGFSIVEIMTVVIVSVGLLSVIFAVFMTGRSSWSKGSVLIDLQAKTRLAMDRMVRELSASTPSQVNIEDCGSECVGQIIRFRVPVVIDGSIYDADGNIIWGAEGTEGWSIQYFTDSDQNLIRRIPEDAPLGACCDGETCYEITQDECTSYGYTYQGDGTTCDPNPCETVETTGACCVPSVGCEIRQEYKCDSLGGIWQGLGTTCSPNPCSGGGQLPDPTDPFSSLKRFFSSSLAFAQENLNILATGIKELNYIGTLSASNPQIVIIIIKAQRTSLLGEIIEVELDSTVTFRNKSD